MRSTSTETQLCPFRGLEDNGGRHKAFVILKEEDVLVKARLLYQMEMVRLYNCILCEIDPDQDSSGALKGDWYVCRMSLPPEE